MATAFAPDERATELELQDRLSAIVERLQRLADDQVKRKGPVERRWLDNLRAFHGRYDEATERGLRESRNKSQAFVKITRKKANSWEARLSALLFPTDEENWGIKPTPVPTLTEEAKAKMAEAEQAVAQANAAATQDPAMAEQMAGAAQGALDEAAMASKEADEATLRSRRMQREMHDQLVECDYAAECRKVIRDGVRLGTGILKGPLAGEHSRGKWLQIDGEFTYNRETDPAPVYRWVNPWNYFPDMSAIQPEDREFELERHLWSAKDLRRLARENGFSRVAVNQILEDAKTGQSLTDSTVNYLTSLRAIGGYSETITDRYVGWEYHGPLSCEDISILLRALGQDAAAEEYEQMEGKKLQELRVICYFCEGKVLKLAAAYPLDSGESLYSLFTFEESEGSLFGYGIPEIMADSQKSMNAAWRMALDNAALSVGPQIFIDRDVIEPANGDWTLQPRKIWYKRKGAGIGQGTVLETKAIENNVNEIMNIVEISRRFIDDETALPVQAEGEYTDNPNITATATNFMSLASNITFRRVVKNFDDGITAPSIRRLYDWNMQHNPNSDIKGDMKVDARGSGALLQREMQQQMLLNLAQNWSSHPVLGYALKTYDTIAATLRSAMIPPEEVLVSKEEFDRKQAEAAAAAQQAAQAEAAAQQEPQQDPNNDAAVIAAQTRLEAARMDAKARMDVAMLQRDTELIQLAQKFDISIEQLKTKLDIKQLDLDHKERVLAMEAALEDEARDYAERTGQKPKGSGGYVSQ